MTKTINKVAKRESAKQLSNGEATTAMRYALENSGLLECVCACVRARALTLRLKLHCLVAGLERLLVALHLGVRRAHFHQHSGERGWLLRDMRVRDSSAAETGKLVRRV